MSTLSLAYAGSLARLVEKSLGPAWQSRTGQAWSGTAGGSRELACRLRRGELRADVLLSADEQVFQLELGGPEQPGTVAWYVIFATTELGLAFYPTGRFRAPIEAALAGRRPWWDVLQEPGLRIARPDPDRDPKGYRTLFVLELAERLEGVPGLAARVLGSALNPAQLVPAAELIPRLRAGEFDVCPVYRSQAVDEQLPFLPLPETVNLGHDELADLYRQVCYVSSDGVEYRGAPIRYAAALTGEQPTTWAASFLVFLAHREAQAALAAHGFRPLGRFVPAHQQDPGEHI